MRPPSDMPTPSARQRRAGGSNRGRTLLVLAAIALFVLITSLRGIAGFYTDLLWFDSLGYEEVWRGVLGAKFALAAIFVTTFFVICWANLYIADRLAPRFPPPGPEQEALERFRDAIGHRTGLFRVAVALLLALVAGLGMSQEWRSWLLFVNGGDWGRRDAQFDTDIGFYVFKLPFLSSVADWAFASILIILVVTVAAHFANGGIRAQPVGPSAAGPRVTSQVKAHISVLLGVLALIRAGGYYLQRFELTTSSRGVVDGALYTDVNAQLPVLNLLTLISVASFVLFIVNIWRRGWVLPILGVGLWGLVAVVAGGIYPQVIQRVQVEPNESATEEPFIERNIAATREAYDLEGMRTEDYDLNLDAGAIDLSDNVDTVRNVRLWDPASSLLGQTFSRLQQLLPYYAIRDVDVDRYTVDGEVTLSMLAARSLDTSGVPASSWEARHTVYTHGYGVVLASGTSKTEDGRPVFALEQVPVQENTDLSVETPQIYFSEGLDGYVVTGTDRPELDFQIADETRTTEYDGRDGVAVGSLLRRVAFGLRFGDYNPVISGLIGDGSKIHYIRDVRERVETLAPFLNFDADPYPVIDEDGGIQWIADAYTTTDRYPYAQSADNRALPADSGLGHGFNYVRNSVKAVVDAYDGTVTFYIVDDEDPIVAAWARAFPDLFTDGDEMPEDLRSHVRYPEDIFRVQTNMWGRYHVENATTFYNNNDAWNIALDPGTSGATPAPQPTTPTGEPAGPVVGARVDPYYLLTELPREEDAEFVMLRSFVPFGNDQNQQLTAYMVARSDPENYGELVTYVMPRDRRPDGPAIVADAMQSDPEVSELQTLLGGSGSEIKYGNVILVPVDGSLVYVRSLYVESDQVEIPELTKVIAYLDGEVAVADTLVGALSQLVAEVPDIDEVVPTEGGTGGEGEGEPQEPEGSEGEPEEDEDPTVRAARLLEEARSVFDRAQEALTAGDLGEYQRLTEEAEGLVSDALEVLGGSTTTTTAPGGEGAPTTTAPEEETEEA